MSPELVPWIAALLFIVGLLALVLEVFVVPGFGIPGIAGLIMLTWGVLLVATDIAHATTSLVIALVLSIVLFLAGIKIMARFKLWTKFTLPSQQQKEDGYFAAQPELGRFVGKTGVALTPLRPAGAADVDGQRLDVITQGDFIPPGSEVMVLKVEGARVVVRSVTRE